MSPGVVIEGLGKILAVCHQRHPPQYSDKSSPAVKLVSHSRHRVQRILRGISLSLSLIPFLLFSTYPLPPPCNLVCKHMVKRAFVSVSPSLLFRLLYALSLSHLFLSLVLPSAILPVRRLTKSSGGLSCASQ